MRADLLSDVWLRLFRRVVDVDLVRGVEGVFEVFLLDDAPRVGF
jgi:hypothetical protein